MEYQEIEKILHSDVVSVVGATDKEKEIFSDQKGGAFFTFNLASGQKLVGSFTEEGKGLKKKRILTFRPLNHVVKGLKEVSYTDPCYVLGEIFLGGQQAEYEFEKGISDKDKEFFMDVLDFGRPGDIDSRPENPPFLDRALRVSKAYFQLQSALKIKKKRGATVIKNASIRSR